MTAVVISTATADPAQFDVAFDDVDRIVRINCMPLGLTMRLSEHDATRLAQQIAATIGRAYLRPDPDERIDLP